MFAKIFSREKDTQPKILVEFSLKRESKEKLQTFLDDKFGKLKNDVRLGLDYTLQDLADVIRETFPKESLKELKRIIKGKSKYALLIHNCPEREITGYEDTVEKEAPEDTYCYHISKALYNICGGKNLGSSLEIRRKRHYGEIGKSGEARQFVGEQALHHEVSGGEQFTTFSAPYNVEDAPTTLVDMRSALAYLPKNKRIHVKLRHDRYLGIRVEEESFSGTPEQLKTKLGAKDYAVDLKSPDTSTELIEATGKYRKDIVLKPGMLLIFDQRIFFHQANRGDQSKIAHLPEEAVTRVLLHHANGSAAHR